MEIKLKLSRNLGTYKKQLLSDSYILIIIKQVRRGVIGEAEGEYAVMKYLRAQYPRIFHEGDRLILKLVKSLIVIE